MRSPEAHRTLLGNQRSTVKVNVQTEVTCPMSSGPLATEKADAGDSNKAWQLCPGYVFLPSGFLRRAAAFHSHYIKLIKYELKRE